MHTINKNIIANYFGNIWSGVMLIAFVPLYVLLMGAESFGLVGVFISINAICSILDLGLSQTLNRQMAIQSDEKNITIKKIDTAKTFETIYFIISIAATLLLIILSNNIIKYWLKPESLSANTIKQTLWIMAIIIGLRLPIALYSGGLNGLQKQVTLNIINCIFTTLQGPGVLLVLFYIKPTIQAFFAWQGIVSLMHSITIRTIFWKTLSSNYTGNFRKNILHEIFKFTSGITGITILSIILIQMDKIILSKLLSLSDFGYYSFASTVAAGTYRLIQPIFNAYYPKFTNLVSLGNKKLLATTYHRSSQLMSTIIIPATLTICFFSKEILQIWTSDQYLINNSWYLISLLVIGNLLNGFMYMPYALQLAHGWTKLALYQNLAAVIILLPLTIIAASYWGGAGAALVWIFLNAGYILISINIMHKYILTTEKNEWYISDIGKPLLTVLTAAAFVRFFCDFGKNNIYIFIGIFFVIIFLYIAAFCSLRFSNIHKYLTKNIN